MSFPAAEGAAIQLTSGNTTISLQANPAAPQLTWLQMKGSRGWKNTAQENLVNQANVNGSIERLHWEFESKASRMSATGVQFVYECHNPHLRLSWEWSVRGEHGPLEHSIAIQNLSATEASLPLQDSFAFEFSADAKEPLDQFWVEKGASSPSSEGVHTVDLRDGYNWIGTSSTYAHPSRGEPREIIPYLLINRQDEQRSGWYLGIEFSGRTRIISRRTAHSIAGEAGLNPDPGPYRTSLRPGETFETPTIFLGACQGGPDGAGNILKHWLREVLSNPITIHNPSYPLLVSNSWGSGMAVNEDQARHMIRDAAALGLEMFHLDAGWFRNVGDWVSNPVKFPHGVESVAVYAHQLGLKFGLWTDWTQAGIGAGKDALNVYDPQTRDWLTTPPPEKWQPEDFKGITIDIGVPAAERWASIIGAKIVSNFHLDMLEHDGYLVAQGCERSDHPHVPLNLQTAKIFKDEGNMWVEGSNETDVSYYAARAYYRVQEGLRKHFPQLLLEICNDGGRMVDFGSAAHGDYFSITDAYDPLSNRRAFFDASYVLPSAMLETYVAKWQTGTIDNFRYMLRSGMMGWFSLMMDSTAWTDEQHRVARSEFTLYKQRLRPLIRNADVYHVSERPDGVQWDGMEYFDPHSGRGVLYAFRGSARRENKHTFRLRGLRRQRLYELSFHDHSAKDCILSGEELMRAGVTVQRTASNTSELVFLAEER